MIKLEKFLLYCAGSNLSIIKRHPTDKNKHVGIGGVVLFTGLLAAISCSYALYTVFNNPWTAILFGSFWGLLIFNLDRFIVSSMRKSGNIIQQLLVALPRLLLAALLGIVISKPLELKIFEKEIDKQLNTIIARNKKQLEDTINLRYATETNSITNERNRIITKIEELNKIYKKAQEELEKEIVGTATGTTTGKAGYGTNAKRKERIKQEAQDELELYKTKTSTQLKKYDSLLDNNNNTKALEIKKNLQVEDNYTGLASRMQALEELGQNSKIIELASLFIMLLFIFMEMAPVLVKLISTKGPYDHYLDQYEYNTRYYAWTRKKIILQEAKEKVTIHKTRSREKIKQEGTK